MLTKNDCMSILVKLEESGLDIDDYMKKLVISKDIPIDVLQFIVQHRGIEVINFYEMLRKKHNEKKSPLYLNIVKAEEDTKKATTTLICLLTQVILYGNKLDDATRTRFFSEVRAEEISRVINEFFKTEDTTLVLSMLKLIKTDLLVLEYLNGRRESA